MKKQAQTSQVPQTIESLRIQIFSLPIDYATMDYGSLMNWVNDLSDYSAAITELGQQAEDFAGVQQGAVEQRRMQMEQAGIEVASEKKYFNLVKAQLLPQPMPNEMPGEMPGKMPGEMPLGQPMPGEAQVASPVSHAWAQGSDLQMWMESQTPKDARDILTSIAGDNLIINQHDEDKEPIDPVDIIHGGVQRFYLDETPPNEREIIAMEIFDILPNAVKQEEPDGQKMIEAPFEQFEAAAFIKDVDQKIRKMAQLDATANPPKAFNMKTAQAKTVENVIMYGPGEKRIDPFLRQPVSDWSVVERNKGFGLVVDDVWNVDWEAVWRGTVMDKYSRPYRDNDGNWVGGYIQKRFEVDKWRPEETNMQLKPGQLRKPRLPEQGVIEARLEHMRATEGENRGYGPETSGTPFNWQKSEFTKIASEDLKKKVT